MGQTISVTDPENGEDVKLVVGANRRRNARHPVTIRELPIQNFTSSERTPPRLIEDRIAFGRTSITARGRAFDGPIPPSAELVRERFSGVASGFLNPHQSERRARAERLWGLIPEEYRERLIELAGVVPLTPPKAPALLPRPSIPTYRGIPRPTIPLYAGLPHPLVSQRRRSPPVSAG